MKRCNLAIDRLGRISATAMFAGVLPVAAWAQLVVSEDFTGTTINNSWTAINGACLTAGAASNGSIPGCVDLRYYITNGDAYQVGGQFGYLGGNSAPSSNASEIPDAVGNGALRLTNGLPNYHESGAIVSTVPFDASSGVQITFKTIAYRGNSGGSGGDGADGISFFLLDASQYVAGSGLLGSWGGSLGYSCSNSNSPYTGQVGAYVGLGIDEYGNFLNGGSNGSGGYNDNTATGVPHVGWGSGNYQWNRIGLRGAGNVAWSWLTANYPNYYPSTGANALTVAQQATAVQTTCETGVLWNYSSGASSPTNTGTLVADYAPIPNGSAVLPKGLSIANEAATTRSQATPIYYVLKIDNQGLLSLSYSYGGGSLTQVLTNQSITASNGSLPAQLLFGFAGSTGGSDNVHEILCFQAEPAEQSDASTTVNLPLDKLVTTAQVYLPSYHTNNWWGQLTAQNLVQTGTYTLAVSPTVNWDASCVLTGGPCPSMNNASVGVQGPGNRSILTWNGTNGVPYEWGNLTAAQQGELDPSAVGAGVSTRLNYLRGDRTDEDPPTGATAAQIYRDRTSVLGDIIHASPFWVGPPGNINYESTWYDNLYPSSVAAENAGESYQTFFNAFAGRENVVYAGANDGLLHGFRTGSFSNGNMVTSPYPNDGWEVLAYMPGAVVQSIHSSSSAYDYSSPNYSHIFAVDAPPRGYDIYFSGAWHTWLVGGLGPGGSAIYALDVTDPTQFSESNAASLVQGEWTAGNMVCNNVPNCASYLGQTYGAPSIGRTHAVNANGKNMWAMVFGNGFPNTIAASISPTFTASIGNRFVATIGDFFTGTIAAKTLTVTAGTPPTVGASISGLNVTAGSTVTAQTGACPSPCTFTLSHKSTVSTAEQMTAATTNMYVTSGSGLAVGQQLYDGPVAGTTIMSQVSGAAGGPGVYTVSTSQLMASQTILGPGTVMIVSANGTGLAVGQTITGAGVAAGTTVTSQIDGDPGSIGHYTVSTTQAVTGEQMSNGLISLNVVGGNGLAVGQTVAGAGVTPGTKITSMGTGTGGPGIYQVNISQTVALGQMTVGAGGSGTAGIYVMLVDPDTAARSLYYLNTGNGPNNDPLGQGRYNGIAYTAPADLDGDKTIDYVYAGDLFGNLWRFDLTSNNPSNWIVSTFGNGGPTPLFSSPATMSAGVPVDQPITTKPVVVVTGLASGAQAVIVDFGTGQEVALTPLSPTSYAPGPQALYGVWDWDMTNWNSISHMALASASEAQVDNFLGGPIEPHNLTVQTLTQYTVAGGTNVETDTSNTVCWYGSGVCNGANSMFGWQISLPGTDEQIIYNPTVWQGILQVNTTIPSASTIYSCTVLLPTGWTLLIDPATGSEFSSSPFLTTSGSPMTYGSTGTPVSGVQTNGTGSITNISAGGQNFYLTDTSNGTPVTGGEQAVATVTGHRVTWSQLR